MTKMLRLGRPTQKLKIFKLKSKINKPTKRFQKKKYSLTELKKNAYEMLNTMSSKPQACFPLFT